MRRLTWPVLVGLLGMGLSACKQRVDFTAREWWIHGETTGFFTNTDSVSCSIQSLTTGDDLLINVFEKPDKDFNTDFWFMSLPAPTSAERNLFPVAVTPTGASPADGLNYGGLAIMSRGDAVRDPDGLPRGDFTVFYVHRLRVPPNPVLGTKPAFNQQNTVERMTLYCRNE